MKFLEMIERQTNIQLHFIEDLLDISRVAAGILKLDIRAVDLASVISNTLDTIGPVAESKEVELRWNVPQKPVMVCVDADRFRQVVLNLLVNAVKFTPSKGSIEVSLGTAGGQAQLTVGDTGTGIEPSLIANIFNAYTQGEGPGRKQGIGLGLPIVKHLVELHEGRIEVHSDGEGKGTTVLVEVPLADSQPEGHFVRRRSANSDADPLHTTANNAIRRNIIQPPGTPQIPMDEGEFS